MGLFDFGKRAEQRRAEREKREAEEEQRKQAKREMEAEWRAEAKAERVWKDIENKRLQAIQEATKEAARQNELRELCEEGIEAEASGDKKKAAVLFRKAADGGSKDGQYHLGRFWLENGSAEEGKKWLLKAAEQGQNDAQYATAVLLEKETRERAALEWYRRAAQGGHWDAQYRAGILLTGRENTKQEQAEGLRWLVKAAVARPKDKDLSYDLGMLYLDERFANPEQAARWLRVSAEQGNVDAQYRVAIIYDSWGDSKKKDAAIFYRMAAYQGNRDAAYRLGILYERGVGVEKDYEQAAELYRMAQKDNPRSESIFEARMRLDSLYHRQRISNGGKCPNPAAAHEAQRIREAGMAEEQEGYEEAAVKLYHQAALKEDPVGQVYYAEALRSGRGVKKDTKAALSWYRRAANLGNGIGQCEIGYAYFYGEGFSVDKKKAKKWLRLSAEQGIAKAQCLLGLIYSMEGPQYAEDREFWLRASAMQGDPNGEFTYGLFLFEQGKSEEGLKWIQSAAGRGNTMARDWLLSGH